ncbi:uncharacterized protein LOC132799244 isoform X1 [Ziziphus jujuba]|uniref:Uncharacterized protein LOC132799244 isoform X1 n=1 Tax=Ziziphus jujuba TaxID=326968 RepID=A0ABM3ZYX4_ZIZJJ|nr:uncharacterized protein LOC132799244 isoform X1 [Ziziphus jujuba]
MMEEEVSDKRKKANRDPFTDIVFSWSVEDIFNENLYQNKVERIPESFKSFQHYFGSYDYPLLEETRAQLHSTMEIIWIQPFAEVISFEESKPYGTKIYEVKVDYWRNRFCERGKEPYKTLTGDVFALADVKPETVSDLQRAGRSWAFLSVTKITDDDNEDGLSSTFFKVTASKEFKLDNEMRSPSFVIFLGNLIPNRRIWKALHMFKNLKVVEKVLRPDSMVEEKCNYHSEKSLGFWDVKLVENIKSKLNESQTEAVLSCLSKIHYENESAVKLIWGPPGTGKTKTTATLLFTLLGMKFRTLICAPTNVAITEVASRVVKVVCDAEPDALFCSLGDILLFGNKERLKVGSDIQDIYLDYRVQKIAECLGSHSGWRHCFGSMINFLEYCVSQYHIFLENEMIKESEQSTECDIKEKGSTSKAIVKSFREFVRERFVSMAVPLRHCVSVICTHMGKSYISEQCYQNMESLIVSLDSFEKMIFKKNVASKALEECFSQTDAVEDFPDTFEYEQSLLCIRRSECLLLLRTLKWFLGGLTFPNFRSQESIKEFCFQRASLIFCTASTSYKLHKMAMEPLRVLVIDEAAQLKECESTIPLQLRGIKHAILVGDECQLPAMVQSKISDEAGFGRSLFERLSSQGCAKHLLNMQYRMHPSISLFPNLKFYDNRIVDAPIVRRRSYEIQCRQGSMYGPYSFINVIGGRQEKDDDGRSSRNMVEVAIVLKILQNLYRALAVSEHKLSIGVVSPYAAQVVAIQDRLGGKYDNMDRFLVKVKTIDGFQGGEYDIIIISSVRCNSFQSVGFISKPQRMNVALTRARHCLWILGNERILVGSQTVWRDLVLDAQKRNCFFNADDDKDLAKAILDVKKEFDQLDDLLSGNSMLFENSRWKVQFSDNFLKSFKKLTSVLIKKSVLNLLLKLSSGWRPKKQNIDSVCGSSMQMMKQFKVEGLYVVSTTDIVKDLRFMRFIQVLKIWDLLPMEDIPKLIKRLESIFCKYTDDFINLCNEKCLEGNLEVPKSWSPSVDIVRFKDISINETGNDQADATSDGRSYVENSKASESLLFMKFYSLSSVAVNHLMSDHDGRELDLPFEVTDQEMEIILFDRSSFILGRSGTGKTTTLTMKLFQKEKSHQMANEGFYGLESNSVGHGIQDNDAKESSMKTGGTVLRQLFVTTIKVRLCWPLLASSLSSVSIAFVLYLILYFPSFPCGGKSSDESESSVWDYIDDEEIQFKNIPDSFVNIPPNSYPLVITFHKFLMMLDGTLSNSYFERFLNVPELSNCKMQSSRSVMLQNILRTKEVNYERFSSSYWPHFNSQLTKNLDPSRVFTEIISYIKGGLKSMEAIDGKLNREEYVLLSKGRASSLNKKKREIIYDIFQSYEKMKMANGEYDLADFVIDLHFRLRRERYEGDGMDFVYIDEVQDLTMSQIALFKHVCSNVEEGFVFSGDTAQTIARGTDFRFQDIRNLFYSKFFLQSRIRAQGERNEKGLISEVFQLTQNFRTHAGILKLSHSIIELIYRFFPSCIDKLKPESSLIYGEAPILLESGNDENAILKIFGNPESVSGKIVSFGAEQVILVRDDNARKEISNYVGKQALVLTILECKGLEFQDVLLYDFFGSSPLTNKWRVIYEYMKEQDLLDSDSPSFPHFNESKHNILCSELKQLYVAVTRTRQRLWICETSEFSKPMFDYWKKKCLVQTMQLDDSLAQAMQVASSPEEWRSRGIKLYSEHNHEMATMCFERAGDTYWERRSKAAGLKSMADWMRISNPEVANSILREAAEIFDAIGKANSAARCFYDLGEYERAGRIYMEKCGESELGRAGECFTRAECYELAAEVYARGDILLEVDLIGKAGNFREAATLILLYVLANSLWSHGSKGWPLKQFKQKQELLAKGKSFAKNDSDNFYELFCVEADIIANEQSNLQLTKNQMKASQMHKSITAEMLCVRKILDGHLSSSVPKYIFEEELVFNLTEHSETMISKNQVSLESMVYFWNIWKEKIVGVFEYLVHLESEDVNENESFGEFCLNFLGVRRQFDNLNTSYMLLHSDADWVRDVNMRHFKNNGKFVSIGVHQLASAAQSYWSSELLFVGIKILEKLQAIYDFPVKISDIPFCKSRALTHIYEVAKFLFESKFLKKRYHDAGKLQKSISLSTEQFFGYVFPLDWRKSLRENMVLLRGMDISKCLLEELIVENINSKNKLSYGQIGRIAMITLGSGKLKKESCGKILQKLGNDSPWKVFFEILCSDTSEKESKGPLICSFNEALFHTYGGNWRAEYDYISPGCFVYLVDHLLIRVSCFRGNFFTTKSSFVEWLMECGEDTKSSPYRWADVKQSFENLLQSMIHVVQQCLYNKGEMLEWIGKSTEAKDIYSLIVSRLVVIVCLINLNFGICQDLLLDLINKNYIIEHLPRDFRDALFLLRKRHPLYTIVVVLAEAFKKIGNDLVVVSSGENFPLLFCPGSAIYVNMNIFKCKNDILRILFPRTIETKQGERGAAAVEAIDTQKVLSEASSASQKKSELPQSRLELVAKQELNTQYKNQVNLSNDCRCVWEILDRMKIVDNGGDQSAFLSHAKTIKVDMEKFVQLLSDGLTSSYRNTNDSEKKVMLDEVVTMTDELKQLSNALDESEVGRDDQITRVEELCNRLQSKRPKMEPILKQLFVLNNTNLADKESEIEKVVASSEKSDEVKTTFVDERNVDSHKVDTEASQVNSASGTPSSSSNTDNRGKRNNNKNKKKKAKKGGKKK